jgi:hypothetical protein
VALLHAAYRGPCWSARRGVCSSARTLRRASPHLRTIHPSMHMSIAVLATHVTTIHRKLHWSSVCANCSRDAAWKSQPGNDDSNAKTVWAGSRSGWDDLIIPMSRVRLAFSGGRQIPSPANYLDTVAPTHPRSWSISLSIPHSDALHCAPTHFSAVVVGFPFRHRLHVGQSRGALLPSKPRYRV